MARWYKNDVIVPWRARKTATHIVVTDDVSRIREIRDVVLTEMAETILVENVPRRISGLSRISPIVTVEYYIARVLDPSSVFLHKYVFKLDLDSLKELTDEERKDIMENGESAVLKYIRNGRIKIYITGLVRTKTGLVKTDVDLTAIGKKGLPLPIPIVVEAGMKNVRVGGAVKRATVFEEKEVLNFSDYKATGMGVFYNFMQLDKFTKGDLDVSTLVFIEGISYDHGSYDERNQMLFFLKNIAKLSTALAKGSAIVMTVPSVNFIPQGIRRQFNISYKEVPTREEIRKRMESYIASLKRVGKLAKNYKLSEELVEAAVGLTFDEVEGTIRESLLRYGEIRVEVFRDAKIEKLRDFGLRFIEPKINFSHVGGMKVLKEEIKNKVIRYIKQPELAREFGITQPRGFILAGIGGTGKTWFVHALAGELGKPVIMLNAADFMSKFVGESEQNLRYILKVADEMGAIIFMDEIDALAQSRERLGAGDSGVARRVVNMLMEYLGNRDRKTIVIGATNLLEDMDKNFLRSGRFDAIYYISPPDYEGRKEILKVHALKLNPPQGDVKYEDGLFDRVARDTHFWVGSDLEQLVRLAKIEASAEGSKVIRYEHFKRAFQEMRINIEERRREVERSLEAAKHVPGGVVNLRTIREAEEFLSGRMKASEEYRGAVEENVPVSSAGAEQIEWMNDGEAVESIDLDEENEGSEYEL